MTGPNIIPRAKIKCDLNVTHTAKKMTYIRSFAKKMHFRPYMRSSPKYLHFVPSLHMDVLDLDPFDNTN